jgi:hypothetical protein
MDKKKLIWQRNQRQRFKEQYGYSETSHYATGGLRWNILLRDSFACVKCGMKDQDHKLMWGRPITIDHIDKNKKITQWKIYKPYAYPVMVKKILHRKRQLKKRYHSKKK